MIINRIRETLVSRKYLLLCFVRLPPPIQKWGLKPQKQKNAAVLQDRYDLQDCGSFSVTN